jgi:hypothetical protein
MAETVLISNSANANPVIGLFIFTSFFASYAF